MILLAILAVMGSSDGTKPDAGAVASAPPPPAVERLCKDVLGRTVRCNPN